MEAVAFFSAPLPEFYPLLWSLDRLPALSI